MRRHVFSQRLQRSVLTALLIFSTMLPAFAGANHERRTARANSAVSIDNFGQVNDHIYRGEQPKGDDYRELAALGIKTIVDLRSDSKRDAKLLAERASLNYINLPLAAKHYPQAEAASRFLEIVNDQTNWPVYVHCAGGRHRTGVMIAVYRMAVDGWDVDRTYQEMKDYDFYTSGGHGCYKDYVYDFYRDRQAQQTEPTTNTQTAVKAIQLY
jgi:protein tyrosine/serine phosphatase